MVGPVRGKRAAEKPAQELMNLIKVYLNKYTTNKTYSNFIFKFLSNVEGRRFEQLVHKWRNIPAHLTANDIAELFRLTDKALKNSKGRTYGVMERGARVLLERSRNRFESHISSSLAKGVRWTTTLRSLQIFESLYKQKTISRETLQTIYRVASKNDRKFLVNALKGAKISTLRELLKKTSASRAAERLGKKLRPDEVRNLASKILRIIRKINAGKRPLTYAEKSFMQSKASGVLPNTFRRYVSLYPARPARYQMIPRKRFAGPASITRLLSRLKKSKNWLRTRRGIATVGAILGAIVVGGAYVLFKRSANAKKAMRRAETAMKKRTDVGLSSIAGRKITLSKSNWQHYTAEGVTAFSALAELIKARQTDGPALNAAYFRRNVYGPKADEPVMINSEKFNELLTALKKSTKGVTDKGRLKKIINRNLAVWTKKGYLLSRKEVALRFFCSICRLPTLDLSYLSGFLPRIKSLRISLASDLKFLRKNYRFFRVDRIVGYITTGQLDAKYVRPIIRSYRRTMETRRMTPSLDSILKRYLRPAPKA